MSDFSYNSKGMEGAMLRSDENVSFIDQISSKICDQLEGIEKKPGYKVVKLILYILTALMAFDIISNGVLVNLFVTV